MNVHLKPIHHVNYYKRQFIDVLTIIRQTKQTENECENSILSSLMFVCKIFQSLLSRIIQFVNKSNFG
ncbi:unnamed protein product [Schistosoma turkestanicum]|nr:unnamed protein product [Schistosoma turkestanicum]